MTRETKALLKVNNRIEKSLSKEANMIVTDMVAYLRAADISEYYQEVVRRDINQMIIDGESRGESVDDIIGGDYKAFCDAVISEVPKLTKKQKILSFVSEITLSLTIVSTIWFVLSEISLLKNGDNWRCLDVTLAHILWGVLIIVIGDVLVMWATKFSFSSKKTDTFVSIFVAIGIFALAYLITCIKKASVLFTVSFPFALALIIILAVVSIACDKTANKKSGS